MYQILKKKIKSVLPSKFIEKNEGFFRSIIAFFYRGNTHQCNMCDFKLSKFVRTENFDKLCPKCGSVARNRRLYTILENTLENKRIFYFSPSKSMKSKIEKYNTCEYITSDYLGEFKTMKTLNIEAIDEPDNYYDVVLCYHVLEHVLQDKKAMHELYRILKTKGLCYVQTPFKAGEIYKNHSITTEKELLQHFGQEDHLRVYSVSGLSKRLEESGFKTEVLSFNETADNYFGFSENENIILAQKS
ncbi:class I SAM-dependent methyltransferase [Bizionia argentinensis JUB59]|uniref:Class I SAM-dependent methyltransferase n=1 Tax=Bizionia argentinensis JUB59 TaxID=1046627 RepID=G2E9W8_9FLAO|nr:methyltransferase domain-containing protein [Bizionia argentinensis]EGV45029.1 class I SAM-dependent methyltransferase [Bizionia argentinensis JUB59]